MSHTRMVRLEMLLDSWKTVRQDTALAVEEFPAAEFDFKPTPDVMTFGEIARHILIAGHALTGMLLAGEDDLAGGRMRELLPKYTLAPPESPDPALLASDLRRLVDSRCAELARRPADFYAGMINRFDGQRVTRLEMLQFIKEHERTHCSQRGGPHHG